MGKEVAILPPIPQRAGLETRSLRRSTPRGKDSAVSGTVEILFRPHTDAPRGVVNTLIPKGCELTGYGRLPISARSLHNAFLGALCASSGAGGECQFK